MVRQFFLSFVLLILFFLSSMVNFNFAQAPGGLPSIIPGVTCGDINPPNNACCFFKPVPPAIPKPNFPGGDQLVDILNGILDQVVKPILDPITRTSQQVVQPCLNGSPSTPGDPGNPACKCIQPTPAPLAAISKLCDGVSTKEQSSCKDCLGTGGVWSAIGCVKTDFRQFIQETLLGWGIGLAGIFALICIIYSAFQLQISRANPERIKKAQELLTSCITGLILIIFSVFILKLIGVDILKIPGFGK